MRAGRRHKIAQEEESAELTREKERERERKGKRERERKRERDRAREKEKERKREKEKAELAIPFVVGAYLEAFVRLRIFIHGCRVCSTCRATCRGNSGGCSFSSVTHKD